MKNPKGSIFLKMSKLYFILAFIMKLYKFYDLRPREVEKLYASLGGKYGYRERLARSGTGSPRMYYIDGHPGIDELRDRATDELRINFEEFRDGLMVGIAERTNPYMLPLRPEEIKKIAVVKTAEALRPRSGSLFDRLVRWGLPLNLAEMFAREGEHEESRTELTLLTEQFSIHCWLPAREFKQVRAFFEKSNLKHKVEVREAQG